MGFLLPTLHVGKQEEASQLVELLRVTGDLEEQGDILHYMTEQYGLSFKVCIYHLLRVMGDLEEQGDILHYMTEQYGLSFKVCILLGPPVFAKRSQT
jgi:hypothetical protein